MSEYWGEKNSEEVHEFIGSYVSEGGKKIYWANKDARRKAHDVALKAKKAAELLAKKKKEEENLKKASDQDENDKKPTDCVVTEPVHEMCVPEWAQKK